MALAALVAACSPGVPQAGGAAAPAAQAAARTPVKVRMPSTAPVHASNQDAPEFTATATHWPAAASGRALVRAATPGQAAGPVSAIAGTPLWVQSVASPAPAASADSMAVPSSVTATVLPHARAAALGVSAVAFQVSGQAPGGGKLRVGLDYAAFAQAYGGNFGTRLQLVELPSCALTTPQVAACRRQVPLGSVQDYKASAVTAVVALPRPAATLTSYSAGGAAASAAGGLVIAAIGTAGSGGGADGAYPPTTLSPSGTWTEGGDTGAFTYSYPLTVPSSTTKLAPTVSLDYNSQEVDGKTAATQAQASWLGDGWQTPDSSITLQTTPCSDNPDGSASPTSTPDECYDGEIVQMSLDGSDTPLVLKSSSTAGGVTTSTWVAQANSGDVITHVAPGSSVFDSYSSASPGSDYWTVTERNGTQYKFGLQHLPGWVSGDQATNSVDTMPVYSAHSGEPCYKATGFTASVCPMVYEWHLDYVTDTQSDAMAYFYAQATNYYGEDNGASNVAYTADSYLQRIAWGFTDGNAYKTPPDLMVFSTGSRCTATTCGALSKSNAQVGTQYPDVPVDLICASGTTCTSHTPALFSLVRLTGITTEQYSTALSAYENIDSYKFTETDPAPQDGSAGTLWLSSITRTGNDHSAGSASDSAPLTTSFGMHDLQNRVFTATYPGLYRYRISSITSETGSVTNVTYGTPNACSSTYSSSSTSAVTSANTDSCFPVEWSPTTSTTLDWFESYAVTKVLVDDATGGALPQETDYVYGGGAAWHYDDNLVVLPKYRTWGQFRGYASVTTRTGTAANDPQTLQITSYYRGMNGDTLPSGTSSVTLQDSQHANHVDSDQLAGDPLEATTYLGSGGAVVTSTVTSYWVSGAAADMNSTALKVLGAGTPALPDLTATMTEPAETWTRTALTDGGVIGNYSVTEADNTYNATIGPDLGLPTFSYSHTDPVNAAYDSCTREQYAPDNAAKNLVGLVSYTETDQVACSGYTAGSPASAPAGLNTLTAPTGVTAAKVAKATETFYDDPSFSTTFPQASAPVTGNATMTRQASGGTPGSFTWQTESRDTYDSYGRVLGAWDADGHETVTTYTTNSVGLTTATQVAAPSTTYAGSSGTVTTTHVTSQTMDPTRALTLTSTDQNGNVTTEKYDALGRVISVWANGRSTSASASVTNAYTVSATGLSGVVTQTLNDEGNYVPSVTIYDSLGRVRQTQATGTTETGDGRVVTDTLYDSRGWVTEASHNYYDGSSLPALSLFATPLTNAPDVDTYTYDGSGRQTEDVSADTSTSEASATVTVYNGDNTTVIPGLTPAQVTSGAIPATAGTVQTTGVNPLGQTTSLSQYTANPTLTIPANTSTGEFSISGGTPSTTTYGYDAMGHQSSESLAGATWAQSYNLLGQEVTSTDPAAGTSTMAYDADGNLLQAQDASGHYTSYTYDEDSRKTAEYAAASSGQAPYASASSPGNETASWVYDNANNGFTPFPDPKGPATTAYSYSNGYAYRVQQTGSNVFGESAGEIVVMPSGSPGAGLGSTLLFQSTYQTINGDLSTQAFPAAGGLPAETVNYTNAGALDLPSAVGGIDGYAEGTIYTGLSQVQQVVIGAGSNESSVTDSYDPLTGSVTEQNVATGGASPAALDDVKYAYNPAGAMTSETDERLGSTAASETQCFAYTTNGQLSQAWTATDNCAATPTQASHATVGDALGTASEYDESWTYNPDEQPASESSLDTLTGTYASTAYGYSNSTELTSAATTGATTSSSSYTYNADGEQATRSTPVANQTLGWDDQGDLTGVTATSGGASVAGYVYGPDGSLFSQTEGTKTTLYLPGEQLTIDSATSATSGARYYSLPGGVTGVRTGADPAYGFEITSDQHGTSTLWLDSTAQVPTWRQYDPYGNPRGTAPGTTAFPGSRGFLNDPVDAATGLTSIGARWYDSATGTFVSLDPELEAASPQQLNGYTYAGDNPVDGSDPTGLCTKVMPGDKPVTCSGQPAPPPYSGPPTSSDIIFGPGAAIGSPPVLKKDLDKTIEWFNTDPQVGAGNCGFYGRSNCTGFQQLNECFSTLNAGCEIQSAGLAALFFQHLCDFGNLTFCQGSDDGQFLSDLPVPAAFHDAGGSDERADGGGGVDLDETRGEETSGLSCGGESFTPDTQVLLASGKAVPIASLRPGDVVLATNTKTGKTSPEKVSAVEVNHDTDLYDLTVKASGGTEVIHTTASHSFWDPVAGQWVAAAQLRAGEQLKTAGGQVATADGGATPTTASGWMWDLTIPGNNDHDFYILAAVAGASGANRSYTDAIGGMPVLVHNSSNCGGIALGLSEVDGDPMALQDFADSKGAESYHDWPSGGDDWVNEFKGYVKDGETPIHFNLTGIDDPVAAARTGRGTDPLFDGHATGWELSFIQDNPKSWSRVAFYRNGEHVANPFSR
jgi:RHS repeat-associated protein